MSDKVLQKLCDRWQKILRLQDWSVTAQFIRQNEMEDPGDHGETQSNVGIKKARIYLLDPIDLHDGEEGDYDAEQVLVHELLHLHFIMLTKDMNKSTAEHFLCEQAIDCVAEGFVKVARAT